MSPLKNKQGEGLPIHSDLGQFYRSDTTGTFFGRFKPVG